MPDLPYSQVIADEAKKAEPVTVQLDDEPGYLIGFWIFALVVVGLMLGVGIVTVGQWLIGGSR